MEIAPITFNNFSNYIGKRVEVEISCYSGGMMYPDHNILVGMNEDNYYFRTGDDEFWHWTSKDDKDCSVRVWDYQEYKDYYKNNIMQTQGETLERLKIYIKEQENAKNRTEEASKRSFENWSDNAVSKVGRALGHHITVPKSKLRKLWEYLFS